MIHNLNRPFYVLPQIQLHEGIKNYLASAFSLGHFFWQLDLNFFDCIFKKDLQPDVSPGEECEGGGLLLSRSRNMTFTLRILPRMTLLEYLIKNKG